MSLPLLLVHGHPFDATMWRPQPARTGDGRRVLAPDLRGYGARGGAARDWAQLAGDLVAALDAAGVARAVVAGVSMGGQLALEMQRIAPDRVAGLLLAGTTAGAEPDRAARLAHADRLEREGMAPYAAEMLHRMVRPGSPAADHVLAMMLGADPSGAAAAQRARADRPDHHARLGAVDVPVEVVVGAEDDLTPPAESRAIADAVPGARLTVVEGAAHLPNLERPAEFDVVLTRLLHRCRPSRIAAG